MNIEELKGVSFCIFKINKQFYQYISNYRFETLQFYTIELLKLVLISVYLHSIIDI
jgi:hypothetical protein